jgi:transcriptional regulator with XRE-family HTH domain
MTSQNVPSEVFTSRLRSARDMRGWSQAELARRAGLPPTSIAHFEIGTRKPSFDNLRRLAGALEVTADYLMGRVDEPALATAGDPLFRDVAKLSGNDREIARQFLQMLASKNAPKT